MDHLSKTIFPLSPLGFALPLLAGLASGACDSSQPSTDTSAASSTGGAGAGGAGEAGASSSSSSGGAGGCNDQNAGNFCNDLDPCTLEGCANGICIHSPAPAGASCGVSEVCTEKGACVAIGTLLSQAMLPPLKPARHLADAEGGSGYAGVLMGPQDFGNGPLGKPGEKTLYTMKLKPTGELAWVNATKVPQLHVQVTGAAVGAAGHIAVIGDYWDDFTIGDITLNCQNSPGNPDAFAFEFTPDGKLLWAHCFDGQTTQLFAVAVDPSGKVILGGNFAFPKNTGATPAVPVTVGVGVQMLNTAGQAHWTRNFPTLPPDGDPFSGTTVDDIAFDAQSNIVLSLSGLSADLGNGFVAPVDEYLNMLAKLDQNGNTLFARGFVNDSDMTSFRVAGGTGGEVFAGGWFGKGLGGDGVIDLGTGPLPVQGNTNGFILKVSAAGDSVFTKTITAGGNQSVQNIAPGGQGDVLIAACQDAFAMALNGSGTPSWAHSQALCGGSIGRASATGVVLAAGIFTGTVNFGLGSLTSAWDGSLYLLRYAH